MLKKTLPTDPESEYYLFVVSEDAEQPSSDNVLYQTSDPELAETLCRLCMREYGNEGTFIHKPSSSFSPDEQVLLDEAISQLDIYDDPDPGVYDPPPSRQTMLRASYAHRVEGWARMLQSKKARNSTFQNIEDSPLTDDVLLQICRTSTEDERVTTEWMADLRLVASLVAVSRTSKHIGLEHAVTMLAACIGQLPQYHPTHFPLGYSGPTIRSHHWMDRDALEQAAKQIVGMLWRNVGPAIVASDVTRFVSVAIRLGFMEQQEYDAWRPGMRSGSGWRSAVTATPYGITKARACLETTLPRVSTNDHLPSEPATPDKPATKTGTDATSETPQESGGENSDQAAVRQLAAALQELRLATGELLHRSETADIYPEPEIKAYYEALRDAESRVDGISVHLAYGRENPGHIETKLRETIQKLSRATEHVASDYNDRPDGYPLSKEDTARGWEALNGLLPLEIVLTGTTMKPGELEMPAEDRRISGLALLLLLAQAYYKMLECVVSTADWCTALDVKLNQSYFWVTTSLTSLLKNHEDLRDFPIMFEPQFPDLYPSTVRNLAWDDMVAPDAERFLSTVQRYVHEKRLYEPEEGSIAWTFVQLYRPSVEVAISLAEDYHKRMHQFVQQALGGASACGNLHASDEISATGQTNTGGEITAGSDTHHAGATESDTSSGATESQSSDKRPQGPSVDIGKPGEHCRVLGIKKKPLTDGQRAVVSELLNAGVEGMSKDAIERIRPSARRMLKTLAKDKDWAEVILLPGQTNGRYRIKT